MKNISRMLAGALLFAALAAQAADDAQGALKRFADGVQTLSGTFTQVQTDDKGKVTQSSSGHLWLARPGRFRWNYEKPYQQQIVCDGDKIWLYDPDLAQVTVRPARETLHNTPAELLSQRILLSDAFTLEDGGTQGKLHMVRLKPKSADGDFRQIELSLDGPTPARMKLYDNLGGTTDVTFASLAVNAKLDESLLRFTPPKGTEVVGADK